jgi:hypothetical protein
VNTANGGEPHGSAWTIGGGGGREESQAPPDNNNGVQPPRTLRYTQLTHKVNECCEERRAEGREKIRSLARMIYKSGGGGMTRAGGRNARGGDGGERRGGDRCGR